MYHCNPCQRPFNSSRALEQHTASSSAHRTQVCSTCEHNFSSNTTLHKHCSSAQDHHYCIKCRQLFLSQSNLTTHLHSKVHVGSNIKCQFCEEGYATASGLIIHLESNTCSNPNARNKLNRVIRQVDTNHVIRLPTNAKPSRAESIATESSWNGQGFECSLCPRKFGTLQSLNAHMKSPVHEQNSYQCPGKKCVKKYKLLSGMIQHVESESCGLMAFDTIQEQAKTSLRIMLDSVINN